MLAKEPDKPDPKAPQAPAAPRKPIDDKMIAQLREAARRRRPWPLATWLLALLIFGVPVGLLVWAFWPRAEPPRLMVTAARKFRENCRSVAVGRATARWSACCRTNSPLSCS